MENECVGYLEDMDGMPQWHVGSCPNDALKQQQLLILRLQWLPVAIHSKAEDTSENFILEILFLKFYFWNFIFEILFQKCFVWYIWNSQRQ